MSRLNDMVRTQVDKAMAKVRSGIRRVTLGTGGSSTFTAQLEGIDDETFEAAELWHPHGLTSRPPTGTEAVAVEPEGSGEGVVVVATANRTEEPSVDAEEVVLYGKSGTGQPTFRLKPNGNLLFSTGGSNPSTLEMDSSGNVEITAGGANTSTFKMDSSGNVEIESGAAGDIDLIPGLIAHVGGTAATAVDFLLKGSTFDTANRLLLNAFSFAFFSMVTQFGVLAGSFTTIAAAHTANAAAWAILFPAAQAPSTAAATAATAASAACVAINGILNQLLLDIQTFLAGSYLATKGKVK